VCEIKSGGSLFAVSMWYHIDIDTQSILYSLIPDY